MSTYTAKDVSIVGAYPVADLLELTMDTTANKHGTLTYAGLIPESEAARLIQQSADMQVVKVSLRDELEFCGYPESVVTECQNNHCILRVTLTTGTSFMDANPHNRFFQDTGRSYADILTESYDDSGVGSLVAVRGNGSIGTPILAYRETDWTFTLRMAGKLGTIVIPNVTSDMPQCTLGIPKRQVKTETNSISYSVSRDVTEYREKDAVKGVGYQNFLRYHLRSKNRYQLGDSVSIDGRVLTVMRKTLVYENGMIEEHYLLGHEDDFAVPFHHNQRVAGLELEGKVEDRDRQVLKLLLDIDATRPQGAKTWFSYSPVTNNGMYSMPLVDEKVMLQWQSERDGDILAVRPDRKNGGGMPPPERHFLTEHDNHMMMIPGKVEFLNPVGNVTWRATDGMNITTNKNIVISAGRNITIRSGSNVKVYSPEQILTKSGAGSIINMAGSGILLKPATVLRTASSGQGPAAKLPERVQKSYIDADTAFKLAAAVPVLGAPQNVNGIPGTGAGPGSDRFTNANGMPFLGAYDPMTKKGMSSDGTVKQYADEWEWMYDYYGYQDKFEYDWKTGEHVTREFLMKLSDMCDKLGIKPDDMMKLMASEAHLNPQSYNEAGAVGLIQFTNGGAIGEINRKYDLGLSIEKLRNMSAVEQLDYVYMYYEPFIGNLNNWEDLLMVNAAPYSGAVGGKDNVELWPAENETNRALDLNKDGMVSRGELLEKKRQWMQDNLHTFYN